jgi:hypothetical protein
MKSGNKNTEKRIIPTLLFIITIWLIFTNVLITIFGFPESAAEFGDASGTINTIFSGLAFLGIIYTIILQRKDLQAQSEMLELQKEELKRTADEVEKQSKLFEKQTESLSLQTENLKVQTRLQKELFLGTHKPNVKVKNITMQRRLISGGRSEGTDMSIELISVKNNFFINNIKLSGEVGTTFRIPQNTYDPTQLLQPDSTHPIILKKTEDLGGFSEGSFNVQIILSDINNYEYCLEINGVVGSFGSGRYVDRNHFNISKLELRSS